MGRWRGETGARFRLYPQAPRQLGITEPETIVLAAPAGSIGPGPSDDRMYAVVPRGKELPYGSHATDEGEQIMFVPPWHGETLAPAMPDAQGHFDHIETGTRAFEAAHVFGCAHFVLDIWEDYFGHPVPWHFAKDYDRLELSVLPSLKNGIIGWGFLEVGEVPNKSGEMQPFSLNFDVIAHEIGHALVYSMVGMPDPDDENAEYYGFHESAADLVALLASLHFDSVSELLLSRTSGNLYTVNRFTRFGELGEGDQIRFAANDSVMDDFAASWSDEHKLAQPLTGAVFDTIVDAFHEALLDLGLIPPEMEDLSDRLEGNPDYGLELQDDFDKWYAREPEGFRAALDDARDFMGVLLAAAWRLIDSDELTYEEVMHALVRVDRELTGERFGRTIRHNCERRGIGSVRPGPHVPNKKSVSHVHSSRTVVPLD